tara:strand:+ start:724 stop:975 length:252 start_codon:yes stop_codon:yes gene_type:complete
MPIPTADELSEHLTIIAQEKHRMQPWLKKAIADKNEKAIYTYENKIANITQEENDLAAGIFTFTNSMPGTNWTTMLLNPWGGF